MHINDCSFYFNTYSKLLWVSLRRSWTAVTNMFGSKLLLYIKSQIVRINKVNADIGSDEMSANKKVYDTEQLPIWSVNSPIFWKKNKLILMIVIHPIFDLTSNKSSKTTCAFQDGNVLNELIDENTKTLSFCMIQEFLSKKYFKLYVVGQSVLIIR